MRPWAKMWSLLKSWGWSTGSLRRTGFSRPSSLSWRSFRSEGEGCASVSERCLPACWVLRRWRRSSGGLSPELLKGNRCRWWRLPACLVLRRWRWSWFSQWHARRRFQRSSQRLARMLVAPFLSTVIIMHIIMHSMHISMHIIMHMIMHIHMHMIMRIIIMHIMFLVLFCIWVL